MRFNRIYEMILDLPLIETAITYRDICNRIRNVSEQINLHLLKLILFGQDTPYSKHWRDEIKGWIKPTVLINVKNKIKVDYYNILYTEPFENGENYLEALVELLTEKYPNLKLTFNQITLTKLMDKMSVTLKELTDIMDKKDFDKLEDFLKNV